MSEQYPSWCCQRCGDRIGWLGRLFQIVFGCISSCPMNRRPRP